MRHLLIIPCLLCLAVSTPALERESLPPDTRWLMHIDVETFFEGRIGQWTKGVMESPKAAGKLELFTAMTGMDPAADLKAITLTGSGPDREDALMWIEGSFDKERLLTLARAAEGYGEELVGDVTIYSWIDPRKVVERFACVIDDDLLVMGSDPQRLEMAIAAASDPEKGLKDGRFDPGIFPDGAIAFALADGIEDWGPLPAKAAMMQNMTGMSMVVKEQDGNLVMNVLLDAEQEEQAQSMLAIAKGMIGLGTLSERMDPKMKEMLNDIIITQDGVTVEINASFPLDQVEAIMEAKHKAKLADG
jgi:hypothetical protein